MPWTGNKGWRRARHGDGDVRVLRAFSKRRSGSRHSGEPAAPEGLLAELHLLDLAGAGHREGVDEDHVAGDLEAGDLS